MVVMITSLHAQEPLQLACIKSVETVYYGKFIFRMKAVTGSGLYSGLMLYKPNSDQPDVPREQMHLEVLGKNDVTMVSSLIITDDASGNTVLEPETYAFPNSLSFDYHTYTLDWTPDSIIWSVDSVVIRRESSGTVDSLDSPLNIFIRANNSCITQRDGPLDLGNLPQYLYLDWMEYHKYHGEYNLVWRDDFNEFDAERWTVGNWTTDCEEAKYNPGNVSIEDGELVLALTDPNEHSEPTGLNSPEENIEIITVPNYREIRIKLSEEGYHEVQVISIQGKLMLNETKYGESFSVPYADLKSGIYVVRVRSGNTVLTRKVFIPE
jgi:hypothetical protein